MLHVYRQLCILSLTGNVVGVWRPINLVLAALIYYYGGCVEIGSYRYVDYRTVEENEARSSRQYERSALRVNRCRGEKPRFA